ncbi:hypothetical protein KR018_007768, partial [Drosophila ironensis]
VLLGVPLDIGFSTFNFICSTIVDLGILQSKVVPDMTKMSFLLRTNGDCKNVSIPLTRAKDLWTHSGFHQDEPTVLFITGFRTSINDSGAGAVAKAYTCRGDTNFVVLDAANFLDTLYSWSALNTEAIGEAVAKALMQLDQDYITNNLHIVGHSLGAQIGGSTGRYYRQMSGGKILKRITGLDPANPCFYDGNDLEGLRSGDARFVDIIHTNPGLLGTSKRAGDSDFFVQGRLPFKRGCVSLDPMSCSHERAVAYFVESVYPTNTDDFLGKRCGRYADLYTGLLCENSETVMGYGASSTDLGLFYVDVNGVEPYGLNAKAENYTYSTSQCGLCRG